jgi:tetratricopeptide (TPR) repeat protein
VLIDYFTSTPLFVALRFQRWDTLARIPAPDPRLGTVTALWHFARGVMFAATGARERAVAESTTFDDVRKALSPDALFNLNRTDDVLGVARAALDARLAAAGGDHETAVVAWRRAVERQDALAYDEPPAWYYPGRESLGAALYAAGRPAEAEAVFREDLARNPRNGRSLFGLAASLRAQGKTVAADAVEREFRAAWAGADVRVRMEGL